MASLLGKIRDVPRRVLDIDLPKTPRGGARDGHSHPLPAVVHRANVIPERFPQLSDPAGIDLLANHNKRFFELKGAHRGGHVGSRRRTSQ